MEELPRAALAAVRPIFEETAEFVKEIWNPQLSQQKKTLDLFTCAQHCKFYSAWVRNSISYNLLFAPKFGQNQNLLLIFVFINESSSMDT